MKTIVMNILILVSLILGYNYSSSFSSENSKNNNAAYYVFDGYEGGYYFFTDQNKNVFQIIELENEPITNYDLNNGNYETETFLLELKTSSEKEVFYTDDVLDINLIGDNLDNIASN
jgi:hypothetical protein